MDTYFGGAFLIDKKPLKQKEIIITPNNSNHYPHFNYVFGMDKRNRYSKFYKADNETILKWFEERSTSEQFGVQGVFNKLDNAKEFKDLFIKEPEKAETISIHLPISEFDELADWTEQELEAQSPKRENYIYNNLKKKILNNPSGELLGFDLLETYYGAVYNMFYETDENLQEIKNIATFNEHGLISTFEDALKAKQFSYYRNVWLIKRH